MFLARRPSRLAISWPRVTLTRVGQPFVRVLRERFRRHSAAAMKRATHPDGLPR